MDANEFRIRTASYSDRSRLANLIHFGVYVHQHLDWKPPLDWIGRQPYLLIEKNDGLLATLACPPELPEITWVRLFAVSSNIKADKAWGLLWGVTQDELLQNGKIQVAALSLQSWFTTILKENQFEHTDNVVVLICKSTTAIPEPNPASIEIRQMIPEDLSTVMDIDTSAFGLEWRNSLESLELAFQQSSFATVAEMGGEIVGYQYSTSSGMGGHLARLAVKVDKQGKGIGYLLVHDVIKHFKQHGVMNITVNTQQSNSASLALYTKAGFTSTGESYRVYQYIF
jgi:ribosomal protein S18 acetylase RimI-like enzyme